MSISQASAGDVSAARVYVRLLTMDPQAAAVFAGSMAAPQQVAGLALLAAQSTADLQRIQRIPNPSRSFRDQSRTR